MKRYSILMLSLLAMNVAIGTKAQKFVGCTQLEEVVLPTSLAAIGNEAMLGCTSLKTITSANVTPPVCGADVFSAITASSAGKATLYAGSADYVTADTWYKFYDIRVSGREENNLSANATHTISIVLPSTENELKIPASGICAGLTYAVSFAGSTGGINLTDTTGTLKKMEDGSTQTGSVFSNLDKGIYWLTANGSTVRVIIYLSNN